MEKNEIFYRIPYPVFLKRGRIHPYVPVLTEVAQRLGVNAMITGSNGFPKSGLRIRYAGLCMGLFYRAGRNIIIIRYKAHLYLNVLSAIRTAEYHWDERPDRQGKMIWPK